MTDSDTIRQGVQLIMALFEPSDIVVFRPIETFTEGGKKRSLVDYEGVRYERFGLRNSLGEWVWWQDKIETVLSEISDRAEANRTNVFYGTCPRLGDAGRYDLAWQIRTVRALWCDVDNATVDEVRERIRAAGLSEPSMIVMSGNGCHVYWVLKDPVPIADADNPRPVHTEWIDRPDGKPKKRKLYLADPTTGEHLSLDARQNIPELSPQAQALQDILAGIAAKIGGDHTQDLSRILRIPGTWNRKDQRNGRAPVPCTLVECDPSRRYALEVFAGLAATSPQKTRRDKVHQVPLPAKRKLTAKREDRFHALLADCAAAEIGQRSEADFALCCWAVEQGLDRADVWQQASTVGKFAEAGERYFEATWAAAESHTREKIFDEARTKSKKKAAADSATGKTEAEQLPLSNALVEGDGDNEQTTPLHMQAVIASILERTEDWPRRVGPALFVHDPKSPSSICWLDSPAAMFGWLGTKCGVIDWHRGTGYATKEEAFCELKRRAVQYAAIEELPHEPAISNHYYACEFPQPGPGEFLDRLLSFFCLETPEDRQILKAAFATPLWGGPPGCRPAFMITAAKGRGKGKSKLAQMLSRVYGGVVDVSAKEEITAVKTRLLSPGAATKRLVLLDNVKTTKFSWGELEALITSDTISGKALYVGDGCRPNFLTWLITLNGASLSTDMAQRVVEIRLSEPEYSGQWEAEVKQYIDTNRSAILGDLVAFLRQPQRLMKHHSRWATWESGLLSRLPSPDECFDLITSRRGQVDVEEEEGAIIEDFFAAKLRWLDYDPERDDVFIPNQIAAQWYNRATGEACKVTGVTRSLKQLKNEGRLWKITPARESSGGKRGFRWIGEHANSADQTKYGLGKRLEKKLSAAKKDQSKAGEEESTGDSNDEF